MPDQPPNIPRDLTAILDEWPFESGQLNVRLIEGRDGEPKIQVRLDLGLLQMEVEGRPDGVAPGGFESLLDAVESYLETVEPSSLVRLSDVLGPMPGQADRDVDDSPDDADEAASPDRPDETDNPSSETARRPPLPGSLRRTGRVVKEVAPADPDEPVVEPESMPDDAIGGVEGLGDDAGIGGEDDEESAREKGPGAESARLGADVCRALREEALQYYHRYVALLVLEDYEAVVRDTTRNLRLLDLCRERAAREEDRMELEQFRPYVTMMHARALASLMMQHGEPKAALLAIDRGLESLRAFFEAVGEPDAFEQATEAQMLRGMREALTPKLPVSQKAELKQRLKEALARENYELAAILRDELRMLND